MSKSILHLFFFLSLSLPVGTTAAPQLAASSLEDSADCDCGGDQGLDLKELQGSATDMAETLVEKISFAQAGAADKVALDLYVMSLCPYALEAQRALLPIVELFSDKVALSLYYIADENENDENKTVQADTITMALPPAVAAELAEQTDAQTKNPASATSTRAGCAAAALRGDGPFSSLHGQPEINESQRQLILRDDHPDHYHPYLLCRSHQGSDGDWHACAQMLGLNADTLQYKALSQRGADLFSRNIRRGNAINVNLSPTLFINGEEFTGRFEPYALARQLCGQQSSDSRCAELPVCGTDQDCADQAGKIALCLDPETPQAQCAYREPVAFPLHVVTAAECERCSTEDFLQTTRELFPAVQIHTHSLQTPKGRALTQQYGLGTFPAYIFGAKFARSPRFDRIQHLLESKENGFILVPHLNEVSYWSQRLPNPGRLDVFLPTGLVQLERELLALTPRSQGHIRLHYLPPSPQGLDEETQRRICLSAHQPQAYLAYLAKRLDMPIDHPLAQDQAQQTGIDTQTLEACTTADATKDLLADTVALYDSLYLTPGSVAALVDNQTLIRHPQPGDFTGLWQEGSAR
jgi:hypothetical protein